MTGHVQVELYYDTGYFDANDLISVGLEDETHNPPVVLPAAVGNLLRFSQDDMPYDMCIAFIVVTSPP
jgi:hypothetical protein